MRKKIGAFRAKMTKKFSTFLPICQNFRKNPFFSPKLSLVWLLNVKMRGLSVPKMCQDLSVTKSLLKIIGGHWVKDGQTPGVKMGVFRWKWAKKKVKGLFGGTWHCFFSKFLMGGLKIFGWVPDGTKLDGGGGLVKKILLKPKLPT